MARKDYTWRSFMDDPLHLVGRPQKPRVLPDPIRIKPRPVTFVSYRFAEAADFGHASVVDENHRKWVAHFIEQMEMRGIEVVSDRRIGELLGARHASQSGDFEFWSEVCRICTFVCHSFIPIITPGYMTRTGHFEDGNKAPPDWVSGTIYEEFSQAEWSAHKGRQIFVPVIRRWGSKPTMLIPHSMVNEKIHLLLEDDLVNYSENFEKIVSRVRECSSLVSPYCSVDLRSWLELYIDWNRVTQPERAAIPDIHAWKGDKACVVRFMRHVHDALRNAASRILEQMERAEGEAAAEEAIEMLRGRFQK